jgi:hypothetical protein
MARPRTYRYLLRPEGTKGDPAADYYSPEDLGYYDTDEVFKRAPVGRRVTSHRGGTYVVTGQLNRNIPDLVRGVLFVRPAK